MPPAWIFLLYLLGIISSKYVSDEFDALEVVEEPKPDSNELLLYDLLKTNKLISDSNEPMLDSNELWSYEQEDSNNDLKDSNEYLPDSNEDFPDSNELYDPKFQHYDELLRNLSKNQPGDYMASSEAEEVKKGSDYEEEQNIMGEDRSSSSNNSIRSSSFSISSFSSSSNSMMMNKKLDDGNESVTEDEDTIEDKIQNLSLSLNEENVAVEEEKDVKNSLNPNEMNKKQFNNGFINEMENTSFSCTCGRHKSFDKCIGEKASEKRKTGNTMK